MIWAILIGSTLLSGAFVAWVMLVYEPRRVEKEAASTRLQEIVMVRKFVDAAVTKEGREQMLKIILTRRPLMPTWPEWAEVWGNDDPLKKRGLLH